MPHALVVEDEDLTLRYLARLLEGEGFSVSTAPCFREAAVELQRRLPDLLLVDLLLPDGRGIDLLERIESRSAIEVVVITGHANVDTVVEALHRGVSDYLTKPIDEHRLTSIVRNVLRIRSLNAQIGDLRQRLRTFGSFGGLIGSTPPMQRVYDLIDKVAPTDATVLVVGESGSGKEVVAKTLHDVSFRQDRQFLAVNCGALSANLIESELFGHERGSFTGATTQHLGNFERAHGATLFLDEIAEMPVGLQVKLLRVLESGTFTRIGGQEQLEVDVRVIAATNRDPTDSVAEGKLREDLFYRLNVFTIEVPPLRDRKLDIDLLAAHFLSELNRADGTSKRLSGDALRLLQSYDWPGNVRELRNVIRRAFIIATDEIVPECLPPEIHGRGEKGGERRFSFEVGIPLDELERRAILATYEHLRGNKKRTAEVLGINLRTLYNRLKAYGIGRDGSPGGRLDGDRLDGSHREDGGREDGGRAEGGGADGGRVRGRRGGGGRGGGVP